MPSHVHLSLSHGSSLCPRSITGKVIIATLDDDVYNNDDWLDSDKDDPEHPDAWQRGIFPS